jgi:hypothetical protein
MESGTGEYLMSKVIRMFDLSKTLEISECKDGFWLWDSTRKMNLSMRATSITNALVEALHYYQQNLTDIEQKHKDMSLKVTEFVEQFMEDMEND